MKSAIVAITAVGLAAGVSSAGLVQFTASGIVTDVLMSTGFGGFSGLSVGDTWSYTMVYEVRDGFVPPASGGLFVVPQWNDPISFVSASFTAGGSTLAVTERDLNTYNDMTFTSTPQYGSDGLITGWVFENGPRGLFDMRVSDSRPISYSVFEFSLTPLDFMSNARVLTNYHALAQLGSILPSGIFGPVADGNRWATFDLEGGRFGGLVTEYSYGPVSGRVVPAPGVAGLLAVTGLAAARRRR